MPFLYTENAGGQTLRGPTVDEGKYAWYVHDIDPNTENAHPIRQKLESIELT